MSSPSRSESPFVRAERVCRKSSALLDRIDKKLDSSEDRVLRSTRILAHGTACLAKLHQLRNLVGTQASRAGSGAAPPRAVVLLVDDDPLVRAPMARTLNRGGFLVMEAQSGEEAIALFEVLPEVAVVVTDTRLPGRMTGFELIGRIRAVRPAQPVLRISDAPRTHPLQKLPPPVVPFLSKPIPNKILLDSVARLAWRPPVALAPR